MNILPTYRLAVSQSMHNRRARVFFIPPFSSCRAFPLSGGEGHTLWLEGSHSFSEVLSLSATGGLLSLVSEKREVYPTRFYASRPALSSESALVAHLFGGSVQRSNTRAARTVSPGTAGSLDLLDLLVSGAAYQIDTERAQWLRLPEHRLVEVIGSRVKSESVPVSRSVRTRPLRFAVATPSPV